MNILVIEIEIFVGSGYIGYMGYVSDWGRESGKVWRGYGIGVVCKFGSIRELFRDFFKYIDFWGYNCFVGGWILVCVF